MAKKMSEATTSTPQAGDLIPFERPGDTTRRNAEKDVLLQTIDGEPLVQAQLGGDPSSNTRADTSVTLGRNNTASTGSAAVGEGNTAAWGTFACGINNQVSGNAYLSGGAAVGDANIVTASGCALGRRNNVTGGAAYGIGEENIASADEAFSIGVANLADEMDAFAIGKLARAHMYGQIAHGFSTHSSDTDMAQQFWVMLTKTSTDATPVVLTIERNVPKYHLEPDSMWGFTLHLNAQTQDAAVCAAWVYHGAIRRSGNTTALVGTPTAAFTGKDSGASAWSVAITADDANETLAVTVTGAAGTTIRWSGLLEVNESIWS